MIQTILKALSKIHLNSVKEFDHKTPMTGRQFRLKDDDIRAQDVGGGEGDKVHQVEQGGRKESRVDR